MAMTKSVAVVIPCYNEEVTIAKVVNDFRAAIPHAILYVYDNNSTDRSIKMARSAGAIVRTEPLQGKGHVVRRMFADIEADIYVLVDSDDTYDARSAPAMIARLVDDQLDMVNASRISDESAAYRKANKFGNALLSKIINIIFSNRIGDLLSGYRVFSRRFVKSFPALSFGFEIETELTVHALELNMPIAEIETPYYPRPDGSVSKLNTYQDGIRILLTIFNLVRDERPLAFFSIVFAALASSSVVLALPVLIEYLNTGLVPRFPTAILATGMMLLAFLCIFSGLILDLVTHGRREMKRLFYLSIPSIEDSHSEIRPEATEVG